MKGGTMRLGAFECQIRKNTKTSQAYQHLNVSERHRHRYEFNNQFLSAFEEAGFLSVGVNPESNLVEIMELKKHPWFIGVQYHPELKSTVDNPHPLFIKFVQAALEDRRRKENSPVTTMEEHLAIYQ